MIRLLQSSWTAALAGLAAYLLTLTLVWRAAAPPPSAAPPHLPTGPSWTFENPELDLLMGELREQREALAIRQKELSDLAARLRLERGELTQLTQAVQQAQSEFDQNVIRVRAEETGNLKRLAKTYAAMSPEGAAEIFKSLDDGTAVKVLTFMRDSEIAAVLEAMAKQGVPEAKRVAAFSEKLRLALPEKKGSP